MAQQSTGSLPPLQPLIVSTHDVEEFLLGRVRMCQRATLIFPISGMPTNLLLPCTKDRVLD